MPIDASNSATAASTERALALHYAPASRRAGLAALFALDSRLGDILRTTREPLVGQMRLVWWRDALTSLDAGSAPPEPVLAALARDALPLGLHARELAVMSEGWEQLLVDPLDRGAMVAFATGRGAALFEQAALLLTGRRCKVAAAGEGWALADLAGGMRDPVAVEEARGLARARLQQVTIGWWPRPLRPLGALTLLARSNLAGGVAGSPARVSRLLLHRLTGR